MKSGVYKTVILIFIAALLNVAGQMGLKQGINQVGKVDLFNIEGLTGVLINLFSMPVAWLALFCAFLSFIIWLAVLSRVDLSLAYPLASISFVLVVFCSWVFLKEPMTGARFVGAAVICCGIVVIR